MLAIYAQEGEFGPEAIGCEVFVVDFCLCVMTEDEEYEPIAMDDVCLLGFSYAEEFYPEDWDDDAAAALELAEEEDEDCDCEFLCDDCDCIVLDFELD